MDDWLNPVKGTKDYFPEEQIVREYITDVLRSMFKLYGYKPIETSILDYWEAGANKYGGGEEILNETYRLKDRGNRDLILRYELTFKLAKLIAQKPNLRLPFKRYEIGKVFRDGPVKTGRLREFTQCDVDVVGSSSIKLDAEFMALAADVFEKMGLDIIIQINNKKLQFGLFEVSGIPKDQFIPAALSLDKLVKFGREAVIREMMDKGIGEQSINRLFQMLDQIEEHEDNETRLSITEEYLKGSEMGRTGITELIDMFKWAKVFGVSERLVYLPSLARGLGYYTGNVWEVYLKNPKKVTSSLGAGGRWDQMISKFLGVDKEYPAVGCTFGLDVIYTAIKEELGLSQMKTNIVCQEYQVPKVYIIPIRDDDRLWGYSIKVAQELRHAGISTELAYDKKLNKGMNYANKEGIPFVVVVGDSEVENEVVNLKDMKTGEEEQLNINELISRLKE